MPPVVNPIPQGYSTCTPYLVVGNAAAALDFYQKAFGATIMGTPMYAPGGNLMHAEFAIGTSRFMMGERSGIETPEADLPNLSLYLYVEDCDAMHAAALTAGAKQIMPVADQFYGDRSGGVRDAFGICWWIATHKEDVSQEEMAVRAAARSAATT